MFLALSVILLPGISGRPNKVDCEQLHVANHLVAWGHKTTNVPRHVEAIIIHSSYNVLTPDSFSIDGILNEYRGINVSPHYIIDRKGTIYRLVIDNDVAYHAGRSSLPDGTTNVNAVSIGIELINTPATPPDSLQYASLVRLVKCLRERYPVKFILGHSDIAPGRKSDPWKFNWNEFRKMLNVD